MGLRCRDGDLALVIYDEPGCESNIGRTVQVRGPSKINDQLKLPCWLIQPVHQDQWKVAEINGEITAQFVDFSHRIEQPDSWLLPLREIAETDTEWGVKESIDEWLLSEFGFEELERRKVPITGKQCDENLEPQQTKPQSFNSHADGELLKGGA